MKFYFLFFIFIIVNINIVGAGLNLAPGKLNFNMETNNELCKEITIVSNDYKGEIRIRDVWASVDEGSNINKFYLEAGDFDISISYPNEIDLNERETIDVCLSGSNIKQAKGAIIFTPNTDTNIVVEVGTW